MAGLLNALGMIVGSGVAQGAKAYGESFVEQLKQQALALREENVLRLTDKYATVRQETQNKFLETQEGGRQTFETGRDVIAAGRADDRLRREIEQKKGIAETEISARKDTATAMAQTDKDAAIAKVAADKETAAAAALNAKNLATHKDSLDQKGKTAIEKAVDGLVKVGVPRNQAVALTLADATKETTKQETTQLKSWVDMYLAGMKAASILGTPPPGESDRVAAEVTQRLGFDPATIVAKRAGKETAAANTGSGRSLADRVAAIKPGSAETKTPAPVLTVPTNDAFSFGAVGETGVPPGFSPRAWNKMSPAEQAQARKDYVAGRKKRATGLLENK